MILKCIVNYCVDILLIIYISQKWAHFESETVIFELKFLKVCNLGPITEGLDLGLWVHLVNLIPIIGEFMEPDGTHNSRWAPTFYFHLEFFNASGTFWFEMISSQHRKYLSIFNECVNIYQSPWFQGIFLTFITDLLKWVTSSFRKSPI